MTSRSLPRKLLALGLLNLALAGAQTATPITTKPVSAPVTVSSAASKASTKPAAPISSNIYQYARAGMLSPAVKGIAPRVYVPNGKDATVSVIDPKTYKVIAKFKVDQEPQHVVPAHNLKMLYVASDKGRQSLTPIDPRTGKPGAALPTPDPYNLYFTPDGKYAMVVAENEARLDFIPAGNLSKGKMKPAFSIPTPCKGVNHMDFGMDGQHAVAACEFSGDVIKVDLQAHKVTGKLHIGGMPQDVRISPDAKLYFVADMMANGIYVIEASGPEPKKVSFIPTGKGAHGLYPSRDGSKLYISNRGEGTISVMDFKTHKLVGRWVIPGGGSPDMGSVSADGNELWISGRYSDEVYVFDTRKGKLSHRIKVGQGPHGLTYFPQPGRYSVGHTGNYR